jgi:hypothetical protein
VIARLGRLPDDSKGRARFYIDGMYAQSASGTVGAQISVWVWDGNTARPPIAHDYGMTIDQAVGTRLEGDLLNPPEGIQYLGEKSTVPLLDVVDEPFYRVIHQADGGCGEFHGCEGCRQIGGGDARLGIGRGLEEAPYARDDGSDGGE